MTMTMTAAEDNPLQTSCGLVCCAPAWIQFREKHYVGNRSDINKQGPDYNKTIMTGSSGT